MADTDATGGVSAVRLSAASQRMYDELACVRDMDVAEARGEGVGLNKEERGQARDSALRDYCTWASTPGAMGVPEYDAEFKGLTKMVADGILCTHLQVVFAACLTHA